MSLIDKRQHAPAAERNREPIVAVLAEHLPASGTVLEIASGTGQHAVFFAERLAPRSWLPSDPNPIARDSISSWRAIAQPPNLYEPLAIDVTQAQWPHLVTTWQQQHTPVSELRAIVNINMIHIAPWIACEGLFAGAAQLLTVGDVLYLYGPFKQGGRHTAPSNAAFDRSLQQQNPAWGIRDLEAVCETAQTSGFVLQATIPMPANNLSVIFHATDGT
ncbi:DUF938 domain-containing protein [Halomicronema sp. CCY15110]|uniref:DUF938 domain-containing protein n=1 Tax=Halomicronema sp. CCY15110 TaxID=2767773 RepID=UPI00194DB159|nr:DUF938 domain-containing protein [Halomicronema sp. CCY15110]